MYKYKAEFRESSGFGLYRKDGYLWICVELISVANLTEEQRGKIEDDVNAFIARENPDVHVMIHKMESYFKIPF